MFGCVKSAAILGIDGYMVQVEADIRTGLPEFDMVGFLASEVKEARERVRTALNNSGFDLLPARITVNLSPADMRKEGNYFDLPIAVAILTAVGILSQEACSRFLFVGELSLDGSLRSVDGIISIVSTAKREKISGCIVPRVNGTEGAVIQGVQVYGMDSLNQVVEFLKDPEKFQPFVGKLPDFSGEYFHETVDFSEINGQTTAKRAAVIAASGMHNLLLIGPPGSGKSMIARRIPGILPQLTLEESIEISKIYSISGLLQAEKGLVTIRPFRAPHHTISASALIGGGKIPRPGEISLANGGILFLDELPEFQKSTLEVLRQPLEDKRVVISRVHGSYTYPTNVMLVSAMNPCPCGYYPDRSRCRCSLWEVRRYLNHISQPLLDRIDISVEVSGISYKEAAADTRQNETSAQIRKQVKRAIAMQQKRYQKEPFQFNAQLSGSHVKKYCCLGSAQQRLMEQVFETMELSARAYHKILKVARTIADLDGAEEISETHLAEAIGYRCIDKKYWGNKV